MTTQRSYRCQYCKALYSGLFAILSHESECGQRKRAERRKLREARARRKPEQGDPFKKLKEDG